MKTASYNDLANSIRFLAADAIEAAKSGHPGLPLGMAEVAAVLFHKYLVFDPAAPTWHNRDRFILSAGHGSMLLYALLHLIGVKGMSLEQLKAFRQLGSETPGHPEVDRKLGIETTTGPLGQGLATAVGMAIAETHLAARLGPKIVNHYTYVIASDGDMMEGISHEAASLAGHLKLGKLIVFYDDNKISIDGPTDLSFTDDTAKRFQAYGWQVVRVNGHNPKQIANAIDVARDSDEPSLIICATTIAKGAPNKAGSEKAHGSPLGAEEVAGMRKALNWSYAPFEIPKEISSAWKTTAARGAQKHSDWQQVLESISEDQRKLILEHLDNAFNTEMTELVTKSLVKKAIEAKPQLATRKTSGICLTGLVNIVPQLLGGSADLTPSNNTLVENLRAFDAANRKGRYLHYGVREHAMGAITNGMALHGGVIPYAGTFLCFSDYMRPAMRLAALMKQRVIYVMTHDSIALGEDGPTHQPVEHLDALRVIPNLAVYRPADLVETAWCWQCAIESADMPSVLSLSRQALPASVFEVNGDLVQQIPENPVWQGGYVIQDHEEAEVTYIASGSEVSLALKKAKAHGKARVVSVPCFDHFAAQKADYIETTLGAAPRIFIEAATGLVWHRFCRHNKDDKVIGLDDFGRSGKGAAVYQELLEKQLS